MQSFQGEGSWSSRVATLVTLCVPVLRDAYCPPVWWAAEIPMWNGCLGGGMLSAVQGAYVVAPGA